MNSCCQGLVRSTVMVRSKRLEFAGIPHSANAPGARLHARIVHGMVAAAASYGGCSGESPYSRGFVPCTSSAASGVPSPSVSGLLGSVPRMNSFRFERLSWSASA